MAKFTKPQVATVAKDLREVYLLAFTDFSTDPSEIAQATDRRINSRYARELLATLVQHGMMTTTTVNGADEVWQCLETRDNTTRGEAEARIDAWLASFAPVATAIAPKVRRTGTATKTNPAGLPGCLCGCGEVTNRTSNYRPGHDARHAGQVGRALAVLQAEHPDTVDVEMALASLPTAALRAKAMGVAAKAGATKTSAPKTMREVANKAKRAVAAIQYPISGSVKVGRWTYPAAKDERGTVKYVVKGGVTKVATAAQAERFIAGE